MRDPKPDPAPRDHVRVGLGYLGSMLAPNAPWNSGAALDVGVRIPVGFTAAVTVGWTTGRARDDLTDLRLHRVPVGLAVGYALDPEARVSGRFLATGVAEWMRWTPTSNMDVLGRASDIRIGMGLQADLVVRLHRGLAVVISAAGTGWLRTVRVDVDELGTVRAVLEPFPFGAEARAQLQYEF